MFNNSKYFNKNKLDGTPYIVDRQFKVSRRLAKHPKVGFWDKRGVIFEGSLIVTLLVFITLALVFQNYNRLRSIPPNFQQMYLSTQYMNLLQTHLQV